MDHRLEPLSQTLVYANPIPSLRSRHGFFPGIVRTRSGELVALVSIGEAFESDDQRVHVIRSSDRGHTWAMQGPLHKEARRGLGALKPTLLDDGTLVAIGYAFYRDDPDVLTNPQTGGLPPGDNLVSFSRDDGRTWSLPARMELSRPELLELAGPCIQLRRTGGRDGGGDLLALASALTRWDGSRPSGSVGIAVRSRDRGLSWNDKAVYFDHPTLSPLEARLCQLEDGRVVGIVWALDEKRGVAANNHTVVSRDEGRTWSPPLDTGIAAQSSNLWPLEGNRLLSVHAHRESEPLGIIVRLCELDEGDRLRQLAELNLWDRAAANRVTGYGDMGAKLKFGQPALLAVGDGEYLAYHWAIEDGQGRILAHRFRLIEG